MNLEIYPLQKPMPRGIDEEFADPETRQILKVTNGTLDTGDTQFKTGTLICYKIKIDTLVCDDYSKRYTNSETLIENQDHIDIFRKDEKSKFILWLFRKQKLGESSRYWLRQSNLTEEVCMKYGKCSKSTIYECPKCLCKRDLGILI